MRVIKVNIQHGELLEPFFNFYVQNSPDVKGYGWKEWTPPNKEKIEERIKSYKNIWAEYGEKVLNGISSALGMSFKEDINVYIVAGVNRSMSNPLIIKSGYNPKNFIVTITHELTHRILASNKDFFGINNSFLLKKGDNDTVNSHIIVYAVLREIFEDKPDMLKIIIPDRNEDYIKAYELSESYKEILKYFRDKIDLKSPS